MRRGGGVDPRAHVPGLGNGDRESDFQGRRRVGSEELDGRAGRRAVSMYVCMSAHTIPFTYVMFAGVKWAITYSGGEIEREQMRGIEDVILGETGLDR